jgi:hypothetical protein
MKKKLLILISGLVYGAGTFAQVMEPFVTLNDNPGTYAMHICFDGTSYFTVNGGVAKDGKINQFNTQGEFVKSHPVKLDMRSIMYNSRNKTLYVNTKDKEIHKVVDLVNGTVELVHSGIYENEQSSLAMDPGGKNYYALDNGTLSIINAKNGKLVKQYSGIKCGDKGMKGSTTVAVDRKHFYTWDTGTRTVYMYSLKGVFVSSFQLKSGTIGHSLSIANGMLFVAKSDMGRPAVWYGYKIPSK